MLLITRKTDYALLALASLANLEPQGTSARELSERLHLPLPVLRNILKQLARSGVLKSTRGTKGGYRLAKPPSEISLAELVEAIEGPLRLTRCCPTPENESEQECKLEETCIIQMNVRKVHARLMEFLGEVKLAEIAAPLEEDPSGEGVVVTCARDINTSVTNASTKNREQLTDAT
ncbi:MAG: Rrf2 family transcriptional regulator [Planctomycetes bacterium]|nr:Rrf2 family transcriptional regulator [Planctomycetota bacterium]